jgi:hypothetical protein
MFVQLSLGFSVGKFSAFLRIILMLATMFVATKGLLHPTSRMAVRVSILGRQSCWVSNRFRTASRQHDFVETTKRTFCPSRQIPLRASGLQSSASPFENILQDNADIEGIDLEEEIDDLNVEEEGFAINLPKGTSEGFYIVKTFKTSSEGFDMNDILSVVDGDDIERLELTSQNISVPVALMMVDAEEFPSRSRARKACRKANIMIHRGPLGIDNETGEEVFDSSKCIRARVGDRVFPGGRFGTDFSFERGRFSYNHFIRRLREANTDG